MRQQKTILVPYMLTLRDEVILNQKLIIEKQRKLINTYKYIIKSKRLLRNKRYSQQEKADIVLEIESSSKSSRASLRELGISRGTFHYWKEQIKEKGGIQKFSETRKYKYEVERFKEAVFSILHSPPKDFGFNRASWRLPDIHAAMIAKGLPIGHNYISKIIKNAGYRFRSAKKVLTSTDPNYKEKLSQITQILSKLRTDEKFFSIDEFGPFAIKIQGGRSYVPPGMARVVPQIQKSKGFLIITAALELSTNQITHFYSKKKDTEEMIKLLELLTSKYADQKRIFFSWDAASWHASKKFTLRVDEHNKSKKLPKVKLAPLPACAQFLNVIESVFSGMAKAIIHNSDYQTLAECMEAIDRYFKDRNKFYQENPKRAGNKI
ncbi:MAG: IS630 family transposase [Chitinophagaceae bacterium]|nr:IS630 family transposase [Chitinophagaceae bacterium]